jgi:hypothetical protein
MKDAVPTIFPAFPKYYQGGRKPSRCSPKKLPALQNKTGNIKKRITKIYIPTGHSCIPSAALEIQVEMEDELVDPLDITGTTGSQ